MIEPTNRLSFIKYFSSLILIIPQIFMTCLTLFTMALKPSHAKNAHQVSNQTYDEITVVLQMKYSNTNEGNWYVWSISFFCYRYSNRTSVKVKHVNLKYFTNVRCNTRGFITRYLYHLRKYNEDFYLQYFKHVLDLKQI